MGPRARLPTSSENGFYLFLQDLWEDNFSDSVSSPIKMGRGYNNYFYLEVLCILKYKFVGTIPGIYHSENNVNLITEWLSKQGVCIQIIAF